MAYFLLYNALGTKPFISKPS